jgi:hypothetical protein
LFGDGYKFADRLSYFEQIIIARQISDRISVQVAPSFSHFNKVDSTFQNDAIGIHAGGKVRVHNDISIVAEYNQGFWMKDIRYYMNEPKPSVALGIEIGTGTHAFEVFATSYDQLTPQKCYNYNQNDFTSSSKRGIMLGFNLTARF